MRSRRSRTRPGCTSTNAEPGGGLREALDLGDATCLAAPPPFPRASAHARFSASRGRAAPRDAGPHEGLPRVRRGEERVPHRACRDDPRADRPERRGQDNLLQSADQVPHPVRRHHQVQGPEHHPRQAGRRGPPRRGALVPDLGGVPPPHGAGERPGGAPAQARQVVRLLALGPRAEGPRATRARPRRGGGASGLHARPGGGASLRPEAGAGDRHHAGARAGAPPPRRAHRRHGARGRGPDRDAHPAGRRRSGPC